MTDRESKNNNARRRLIKSVVAGGGVLATGKLLPENWARPVVQSVVLPAHAQTSPGPFDGLYVLNGESLGGVGSQPESILDMFVSPAHAAKFLCGNSAVSVLLQFNVSGNHADVCLTGGLGSTQDETTVNRETGELGNIDPVGTSALALVGMVVTPDADMINGELDGCGPFTANRVSGTFQCPPAINSTSSLQLSSPFPGKA